MDRRWRTRRNHGGVNGIGIGLCFRSRRSRTRNSGNGLKPGCASVAGKSRVSQEPPRVTTRDASGKAQPGPWQFVLPKAQTKAEFPKGLPGGPGVGFLAAGEERYMKDLGERAARSSAELGPSVFSKRRTPGGALSAYVEQKGLGPFGFSVSVADLKTA
jgi:hypothetical protein